MLFRKHQSSLLQLWRGWHVTFGVWPAMAGLVILARRGIGARRDRESQLSDLVQAVQVYLRDM